MTRLRQVIEAASTAERAERLGKAQEMAHELEQRRQDEANRQAAELWRTSEVRQRARDQVLERIVEKVAERLPHAQVDGRGKGPRDREEALKTLAVAVVDLFENPDDSKFRPDWMPKDVVEELRRDPAVLQRWPKLSHAHLLGKQRDGTRRCPEFWKRWQAQRAKAAARKAGRRGWK